MVLRARPSRPTSFFSVDGVMRRLRSVATMERAVSPMRSSGCRPRRTISQVSSTRMTVTPPLTPSSSASR